MATIVDLFGPRKRADAASEMRDPSNDFWFSGTPKVTAAGVAVTIEKARTVPVVRDCLQVLSQSIGGLSTGVFERIDGDDRQRRADHPVAQMLLDPNPTQTGYELMTALVDDLATAGKFLAWRQQRPDGPGEWLWRIEPAYFEPEMLPDRSLRFKINEPGRPERILLHDEVWYIPLPPIHGYVHGRSPILKDGAEAIGAALGLMDYSNRFFANDATPNLMFLHKGNFKDEASKENFLSAWSRYFGRKNRHKPGVLEFGMDVKQLAHNNEQSQFLETRKELWLDIARLWRIPAHKVGILDKATFSNIEHQSLEFVVDTLMPWLVLIERSVNKWFLEGGRFYFEFNVASLLRGDLKARYEAYAIGRQWGFLSVNDILRLENRNGIGPSGDRYIEPLNMAPAGAAADRPGDNSTPRQPAAALADPAIDKEITHVA